MAEKDFIGKEVLICYKEGVSHYDRYIPATIKSVRKHSAVLDTFDKETGDPIQIKVEWPRIYTLDGARFSEAG